jgi:uncharacterized protein (DUF1330 family)
VSEKPEETTPMKTKCIVALTVVVGFGLGAIVVGNLHAQAKPPVYLIEEIEVTNPEGYGKEFIPKIQAANKAAGVRALAAGGKLTAIDGAVPKGRIVVQVWDSVEKIQAYRSSAEYTEARKIGEKYAKWVRTFAVEGLPQ